MIRASEGLSVKDIALLFTDLKGSTALYDRIGDLNAFALVQQHFDQLQAVTVRHHGAIIKTIGDAVMAAFLDPAEAVKAAIEMREAISTFNRAQPDRALILKIGLHKGAAIAVTLNDGSIISARPSTSPRASRTLRMPTRSMFRRHLRVRRRAPGTRALRRHRLDRETQGHPRRRPGLPHPRVHLVRAARSELLARRIDDRPSVEFQLLDKLHLNPHRLFGIHVPGGEALLESGIALGVQPRD